jgi:hypothetical protein
MTEFLRTEKTINSLIKVINEDSNGIASASNLNELGVLKIEERGYGTPLIIRVKNREPQESSNLSQKGLFFSKRDQPESVPRMNFLSISQTHQDVSRVIALKDALFIFTSENIHRITGLTPEFFQKDLFDVSTQLIAPNSATVLNNEIWALTNRGVVAINSVSVREISTPIAPTVQKLLHADMLETTKKLSFGLAHEADKKWILFAPETPTDKTCTQALVFHLTTGTWTRWTLNAKSAGLDSNHKIVLAGTESVLIERKGTVNDYLDENGNPVNSKIEWHPETVGAPFTLKQFPEAQLHFKSSSFQAAEMSFSGEKVGLKPSKTPLFRTLLPPKSQVSTGVSVGFSASGHYELQGVSLLVSGGASQRGVR